MKKSKKSILLIVGLPGSGKSTVADVAKSLRFPVFSFGDIVREEVRRRKLKENEENVEKTANWFHSGREYLLAQRMEKKLIKIKTAKPFYIIEGARSPKQLAELRKKFDVKILAVVLPARLRWRRQLARHRSDIRTLKDAKERDAREKSYGIEKIMKHADWRISSRGKIGEFRRRCRRFFMSLLG